MTQGKTVTVTPPGSEKSYEATIEPGVSPREILEQVVAGQADPDDFVLRSGQNEPFSSKTDLYSDVSEGETLYATTAPTVGSGHRD